MTKSAIVFQQSFSLIEGIVEILSLIHTQNSGQLLMTESFFAVSAGSFAYQYLNIIRHLKTAELSDIYRSLTNYLCIKAAVDDHGISYLVSFLIVKEIAAAGFQFSLNFFVYLLVNDKCLLSSTDHTVIESLGVNYRAYCYFDISGSIDYSGSITRANTQCRSTGRISALYHSGTACCKYQVGISHYLVCHIQ